MAYGKLHVCLINFFFFLGGGLLFIHKLACGVELYEAAYRRVQARSAVQPGCLTSWLPICLCLRACVRIKWRSGRIIKAVCFKRIRMHRQINFFILKLTPFIFNLLHKMHF